MSKIRTFLEKYRDVFPFLFFGILTTAVNYAVYLPLYNYFSLSATLSNGVAWLAAVIFAFVTNKPFVFKSYDWSPKVVFPEAVKFAGCRIGSGLLETGIIFLCVDLLQWNGNLMKLLTGVLVIVVNYAGSRLLVFRK